MGAEVSPRGSAASGAGPGEPHRADVARESALEPAENHQRAGEARTCRRQGHDSEVHAEASSATRPSSVAEVEDLSPPLSRANDRDRLSDRANGRVQRSLRLFRPLARPAPCAARQRDGASVRRVGRAADRECHRRAEHAGAADPRSGCHLRRSARRTGRQPQRPAGAHVAAFSVAKWIRGKKDGSARYVASYSITSSCLGSGICCACSASMSPITTRTDLTCRSVATRRSRAPSNRRAVAGCRASARRCAPPPLLEGCVTAARVLGHPQAASTVATANMVRKHSAAPGGVFGGSAK